MRDSGAFCIKNYKYERKIFYLSECTYETQISIGAGFSKKSDRIPVYLQTYDFKIIYDI